VTVSEGDSVLVIGSDGLWENVPLGTVADLIAEHTTAKAAAEALTQKVHYFFPTAFLHQSCNFLTSVCRQQVICEKMLTTLLRLLLAFDQVTG